MAFPSFFIIFVILIFIFQHHLRKNMKAENKSKDEFWQKEQSSLVVRKKEFTSEDFITPNIEELSLTIPPDMDPGDELQLKQLIKRLKDLSSLDMMNFSQLSNTEIRLKFGTANQSIVENNEYTYNNYLKALASYAYLMNEYKNKAESITALEQCISIGSDYSEHFHYLGKLYLEDRKVDEYKQLIDTASKMTTLNKKGILEKLESLT